MLKTRLEITEDEFHTRDGMLDRLLETLFDSCVLIDSDGILIYAAHNTSLFEKRPPAVSIGKHISEVNPYAYFAMDTLKTQKGHWGVTEVVQERKCLMNIFPVFSEEKFLGLLGTIIYSSLDSLGKILAQLNDAPSQKDSRNVYDALARVGNNKTFHDFIGDNSQIKKMLELCRSAANTSLPVLILGESGTGKEILANAIHSASIDRTWNPFVRLNCSAIPTELMESEFFGHEKGAFTGASGIKKGKFELASGGSLLLDEIGDMNYNLQSKLLRVLEEKEFERLGGSEMLPMTARIISSTNSDLHRKSREGSFRSDLYYRLSTIEIEVPPLRDHIEDIPLLVEHHIQKDGLDISLDTSSIELMQEYSWPGNVRELRNVLHRLNVFYKGQCVSSADVRSNLNGDFHSKIYSSPSQFNAIDQRNQKGDYAEKARILEALKSTSYNIPETARLLGICRATVYNRMNRYGISKKDLLNRIIIEN